jgi:prepilin-type processing-associated H-X9-DG protein
MTGKRQACQRPRAVLSTGGASYIAMADGHVAEWLRNGLQNRVPRFNSGRGLQPSLLRSFGSAGPVVRRLTRRSDSEGGRKRPDKLCNGVSHLL